MNWCKVKECECEHANKKGWCLYNNKCPIKATIQSGFIPVEYIYKKIEDYEYIADRATDEVAPFYRSAAKKLQSLIWDWETFGGKWERGEKW